MSRPIEYVLPGEYIESQGLEYLATTLVKDDIGEAACDVQIHVKNQHIDTPYIARGFVHVPTGKFVWFHCTLPG